MAKRDEMDRVFEGRRRLELHWGALSDCAGDRIAWRPRSAVTAALVLAAAVGFFLSHGDPGTRRS